MEVEGRCCPVVWLAELALSEASSHGYGDGVAASRWLQPAMVVWPRLRSHTAFLVTENRASSQQMPFANAEINLSISTSSVLLTLITHSFIAVKQILCPLRTKI